MKIMNCHVCTNYIEGRGYNWKYDRRERHLSRNGVEWKESLLVTHHQHIYILSIPYASIAASNAKWVGDEGA